MAAAPRISRLDFTPAPNPDWADIVYAESIDVFVAIDPNGQDTADKVLRSDDGGVTWTYQDLPDAANWTALAWSEDAGLFAAFCNNNSGIAVATSPDGLTWTNRHAERASIASCVYGNGKFVAVGGQRQVIGPTIFSKSNFALSGVGVSTRTVNINMSVSTVMLVGIVGNTTDNVTGVTYDGVALTLVEKVQATGDRWIYVFKLVAPSTGGTFALVVTFSATNQGSAIYINGYANAGDVLQSRTDTGNGSVINTSLTTTYDESWLAQFSINTADSTATASASTVVRQTTDGQGGAWADSNSTIAGVPELTPPGAYSIEVNVTSSDWAAITVAFRPQVTLGITTSPEGLTWTEQEGPNITLQGVAYSPELDLFVAVGQRFPSQFNAATSSNGTTWTLRDIGTTSGPDLSATGSCVIVWADDLGIFVTVLEDGTVLKTEDGITWEELTLPVADDIPQVLGVHWAKRLGMLFLMTEGDSADYRPLLYTEDGDTVVAADVLTTEDLDGDWRAAAYSPLHDCMVVLPHLNPYAMLVEFGPVVLEVDPPSGDIVGGNLVNVIGLGFQDGAEVVINNLFATDVTFVSDTLLTCRVPPGELGFVDVTVTNPDARFYVGVNLYEYAIDESGDAFPGPRPQIGLLGEGCAPGSISPATGPIIGGTPITIFGQGFRPGSTVLFGGLPATDVVIDVSGTFLTCVTPAHQSGEVDVEVVES